MLPAYQLTLLRDHPVQYPLTKGETSFGRAASCDVRIYDKAVSNLHAKLYLPGTLHAQQDQDQENAPQANEVARVVVLSSNGLRINNVWIRQSESASVPQGAVIDIVGRRFEFNIRSHHHQPLLLDTPRAPTSASAGMRKVRQSMVQRAVLDTPAKTQSQEEQDLMQWSDEDEVSIESKQAGGGDKHGEASDSSDEEEQGNTSSHQSQLCISPRHSLQSPASEAQDQEAHQTSDEEVENSLLLQSPPPSPVSAPAAPKNTPVRPPLKPSQSTSVIDRSSTPPPALAMQPLMRAQSMPNTTPRKRRKSLYEKVLIKSAVKAANHRRSIQLMSPTSPSSPDQASDGEDSSDSLSDPDEEDEAVENSDEEQDLPARPLDPCEQQSSPPHPEYAEFFVDSDEDQDEDEYDVQHTSMFSSEDEDLEEVELAQEAKQTEEPIMTQDYSYIDPELLEMDEMDDEPPPQPKAASPKEPSEPEPTQQPEQPSPEPPQDQEVSHVPSTLQSEPALAAVELEVATEQPSSYFPEVSVEPEQGPSTSTSTPEPEQAEQPAPPPATEQPDDDDTSMPVSTRCTPSSSRASRAARRSSGVPATPAQKSPRRRRSSAGSHKEDEEQPTVVPAQGSEMQTEPAIAPTSEGPPSDGHTTETIPSDLAEFRREMALEAEGKFVPPPLADSYSTPQRPRPAAPRKSALKSANSRPTSPNGTPGSVLGKRKVLFNDTTEYKTIAGIHDEEYKKEQRDMCFVGEVKRRRTSNRLSMEGPKPDRSDPSTEPKSSSEPVEERPPQASSSMSDPPKQVAESQVERETATSTKAPSPEPSGTLYVNPFQQQPPCTPGRTPGKARRVATKTPPAAVARAAQELQYQSACKADVPERNLPKPSRSVSPAKRSKAETSLNMAQLLASPAPKLNHDVFKAPPKTAPPPKTMDSNSVQGVRAQLEQARRQSLSPLKSGPAIHLSPAALGFPARETEAQAPIQPQPPSPSPVAKDVQAPTASSFTPFLSGVKNLLQLPVQPPKTPSFAGLTSMFKQPAPAHEVVDWSSHLDPELFKSPIKTAAPVEKPPAEEISAPVVDLPKSNEPSQTLPKASGIPARARRVQSASRQATSTTSAATPQGAPRRTTRAATGSLKSSAKQNESATSRAQSPATSLRSKTAPVSTARPTRTAASAAKTSTAPASTASSRARAKQAPAASKSQALSAAPPRRAELGKENTRVTSVNSTAKRAART